MIRTNMKLLWLVGLAFGLVFDLAMANATYPAFLLQEEAPKSENSDQENGEKEAENEKGADEKESNKSPRSRRRRSNAKKYTKQNEQFVSIFSPVVADTYQSVVEVLSGEKQIALGVVVDPSGLILTKASEMRGKLMCEFEDGSRYKPEVFGIDPDTDLVLLKINKENLRAVKLESDLNSFVGSWMATVGIKEVPVSIGIVSHVARNIKNNVPNDAIIGIIPEIQENPDNNGVRINRVFTDSPAERSGLLVNDVIIQIDDEPIENRIKLLEQLSKYQPGDGINLKIRRGDEEKEVALILGKRKVNPMMDRGAIQNRMGSTLSKRRSNFPLAIQHDSTLNANECGGPIINIDGKVVGINIARDGRVSSLALPNKVVIPVIKKLKSGKMKPALVNKKEIKRVEKELELLVKQIGDLPKQTTELELKFSAGSAVEDEIRRQVKEAEARVKALKDRLAEKKKENGKLGDSIADIQSKRNRIERRREPLKQRLQQLQTGVK